MESSIRLRFLTFSKGQKAVWALPISSAACVAFSAPSDTEPTAGRAGTGVPEWGWPSPTPSLTLQHCIPPVSTLPQTSAALYKMMMNSSIMALNISMPGGGKTIRGERVT